ncbi:MAG: hypothetical protein LBE07_03200 [Gordonia sp. (in: high G+C Gram-positive bacteria)]|nr:hypothetical protein [Gordonia sp. (in: high G+C Gram-positive bacteria)]
MTEPGTLPPVVSSLVRRPPRRDASTLMGMQRGWAVAVAALIWTSFVVIGLVAGGVTSPTLYLLAMVTLLAGVGAVLVAPGDPMTWWATAPTVLTPTVAVLIAAPGLVERPPMAYGVLTGGGVIITAFTTVRGRMAAAWAGYLLTAVVGLGLDRFVEPNPSLVAAIGPNLAVMLMATVFAAILRPRARAVYALREQTVREGAAKAAEEAAVAVRLHEFDRLDAQARPLLDQIARGGTLDEETLRRCLLVEAQLRDLIRAPRFDEAATAEAVWSARSNDIRVLLLDDGGVDRPAADAAVHAVRQLLIGVLAEAEPGAEVTARILPPGRSEFATVVVATGDRVARLAVDGSGTIVSPA